MSRLFRRIVVPARGQRRIELSTGEPFYGLDIARRMSRVILGIGWGFDGRICQFLVGVVHFNFIIITFQEGIDRNIRAVNTIWILHWVVRLDRCFDIRRVVVHQIGHVKIHLVIPVC